MNAAAIHLSLVDAHSSLFTDTVDHVIALTTEGEVGIYAKHINFIAKLQAGPLRIQPLNTQNSDDQLVFALSGGYLEVCNNRIIILADIALRSKEADEARLMEQKQQALQNLQHAKSAKLSYDVAQAEISLAAIMAELKTLHFLRNKKK